MYRDIRQSTLFANFMEDIGWRVEKVNNVFIYLKKFPLAGYFVKIPRPNCELKADKILDYLKHKKCFKLKISPFVTTNSKKSTFIKTDLIRYGFKVDNSPFNPTTTILIDLTKKENVLFNNFKSAKRRGVRRAIKNGIIVEESVNIDKFIKIRKKQYFPLGFLIVNEMRALWKNFSPKNASLLLAYSTFRTAGIKPKEVAGILLLFYDKVAYYWFASSLFTGKKLFAPTLLVWEAIKISKKKGCKIFDFEGVYDSRFPKNSKPWIGFTKFKEGFNGEKKIYMENFSK